MKLLMAVLLLAQYERVLLPIVPTSAAGAFGSRWETQLWLRNDSDHPVDAFPLTSDCVSSVLCFESMRPYPAFGPRMTGFHDYEGRPFGVGIAPGPTPGGFLYIERPNELSLQLNVRNTNSLGTRIPVVRESEFFTGRRSVLGVPVNAASRIALRVYSPQTGSVILCIEEMTGYLYPVPPKPPTRLVEARLDLQHDAANDHCTFTFSGCPDVQYKPAAIEITDLVARFPELEEAFDSKHGVRIEIEPITPELAYWPMVTVTSNETNEVTLYLIR